MVVASLSLRNLERRYGQVRAVDGLNLEVQDGAFVTLLGPSGCGKSTTLNLIAGLDRPNAGTIHLGDRDVTKVPPNERRMAMVFQSYALYPNMTVFENIGFSLKLLRRPAAEITERVTGVADMLDIGHLLHRKPAELSGGQQQRVALGRALVKQPLVFLLDEPFSNLDAALRARMRTEVKHLHLALGTTSVFVTHDQEEAMTLSDLICVMRDGKIIQSGTPSQIYAKPQTMYVADFVGKPRMSMLDGGSRRVRRRRRLRAGGPQGRPRQPLGDRPRAGAWPDVVARRPGRGRYRPRSAARHWPATFPAVVGLMEPIGSDTFVELDVGEPDDRGPGVARPADHPGPADHRRAPSLGDPRLRPRTGERIVA